MSANPQAAHALAWLGLSLVGAALFFLCLGAVHLATAADPCVVDSIDGPRACNFTRSTP